MPASQIAHDQNGHRKENTERSLTSAGPENMTGVNQGNQVTGGEGRPIESESNAHTGLGGVGDRVVVEANFGAARYH